MAWLELGLNQQARSRQQTEQVVTIRGHGTLPVPRSWRIRPARMPAETHSRRQKLPTSEMMRAARVTSSIREGGTGEIVFSMNGTRHVAAARSDTGQALGKGAEVVVVRSERGIAYVSTWEELGG